MMVETILAARRERDKAKGVYTEVGRYSFRRKETMRQSDEVNGVDISYFVFLSPWDSFLLYYPTIYNEIYYYIINCRIIIFFFYN